ncbi:hypothetical protein [Moorena sp. SIOASIH]|nr:hypothetical protein [Moorena sp. SIOASIH]
MRPRGGSLTKGTGTKRGKVRTDLIILPIGNPNAHRPTPLDKQQD